MDNPVTLLNMQFTTTLLFLPFCVIWMFISTLQDGVFCLFELNGWKLRNCTSAVPARGNQMKVDKMEFRL
jgi:hypothetical protein